MVALDIVSAWTRRVIVVLAAAVLVGCGADSSTAPDSSAGEALELRVAGRADGDLLCPGDRRPCLPYTGELDITSGNLLWVSGRLIDGVLEVDGQQALPERPQRDYSNRCGEEGLSGPPPNGLLETLYEGDPARRPEGFVDAWESDDGVLHIGVSGDVGPMERFLSTAGVTNQVCVVPGFPYADALLESVQAAAGSAARDAGFDNWSTSRDAWAGTVTLSLPMIGQDLRARLDEVSDNSGGVTIQVEAAVEVLNGSVEDYEDALMTAAVDQDPAAQLAARCGAVRFTDVPPDLDEFPPLDDEAQEALDELFTGPTGIEAGFLAETTKWSIALRTDSELVLFGQADNAQTGNGSAVSFEMRTGTWTPVGWGGCRVQIEAPGLGPATVGFEPENTPQSEAATLSLFINEQACASGRPPDDREVVVLVTETADAVSVLALVEPVEGGAECPSNPWYPIIVELDAPLGDRQLLDTHQYPPQPIGQIQD